MSWLNFNDSLNSIKGQISNFATNVLADEEQELSDVKYKELKELCQQQELEIKKLRDLTEEFKNGQKTLQNDSNGTWNWDGVEEIDSKTSIESISALKKTISLLENEKTELLVQLEQLDADNQENLVNIMKMKEKLQYELNDLNDKYLKVKQENKILINKEDKLTKNDNLANTNQKLNREIEEIKKEMFVVKSSNENLQKIIEETKSGGDQNIKKLESENKLLYSELKKVNERVIFFEKKSLEDEDNCQKLAFILETYETQVSSLKKELKEITNKYKDTQILQEENNRLKSQLQKAETLKEEDLKKLNEDLIIKAREDILKEVQQEYEIHINILKEKLDQVEKSKKLEQNTEQVQKLKKEIEDLKIINEELKQNDKSEVETLKKSIEELKNVNEDLLVKAQGRMDIDLENELENIQQEHETQLNILREELELIKNQDQSEEVETLKKSIEELKNINEDLLVKAQGRIDIDLEDESIQQKYETQLNILKEELELIKNQDQSEEVETLKKQIEKLNNINTELVVTAREEKAEMLKEIEKLTGDLVVAAQVKKDEQVEIEKLKKLNEDLLLNTDLETLRKEIEDLKVLNEDLLVKARGRMDVDLEDELEGIQLEHEAQLNVLREELELLKNQENKNMTDDKKFQEVEEQKLEISRELNDLQQQYEYLQENHKISLYELHNKYINIITENIKKFQECKKPSDFEHSLDDDPQVSELNKHVENIIKILLDLRCKCEELEKRVIEISEEKNTILVEKNHEIEKLIQNSDMLSQEILTKNQTIKEYENECNDIAKNNELLITELETFKNTPGLQTISESNEDNMIFLESQLENANRRIEDLEKIIDDLEKLPNGENSDLETEINNKTKDYDDLLNSFDQLQIHYESVKKELTESKEDFSYLNKDNLNLQTTLDKLKSEYEMLEYQVSELKINCESLKEELDEFKFKFKALLSEKSNLKLQNEENYHKILEYETKIIILNEKLVTAEANKNSFESNIETLTEKLKKSKMAETSLKLQYEQKNKEFAALSEAKYNTELSLNKINADLERFQNNFTELQIANDKLQSDYEKLIATSSIKEEKAEDLIKEKEIPETNNLKQILDETVLEKANLQAELSKLTQTQSQLKEMTDKCTILQQQLQEVTNSRNELINMVTMKHQENVTYHNEIQRLNQVLTAEVEKYRNLEIKLDSKDEIEKLTDQNNFLKEKCEVLAKNLLEEQSKVQQLLVDRSVPSEKEVTLQKKLDRLQTHLIELEEHYTEELFQAEQKNQVLRTKFSEIEEREKSSSTMYTSVSIRANQQVESLQSQLQSVIIERDSLRKQISDAEDQNTKQAAALANLQFVLEQFRKDKEKDVIKETERIRRHINTEKQIQEELRAEISNIKSQLEECNHGLLAASRLSDQLESSKKTIAGLKEEASQLQIKLSKAEEDLKNARGTADGKVDKLLIKNLILGYVTSNNTINRDQSQILKIIATVLDFNQQDHDKVKLNKPQQGWLASFLAPQSDDHNKLNDESLSRAFIKFLENESKPRVVPSLLNNSSLPDSSSSTKTTNSRSTTPNQAPIVLSEIVLPMFSDFAQNRNSSSILKDVLKDNS